jgi:DNA uptake protein ComE-like DNA-binding protein
MGISAFNRMRRMAAQAKGEPDGTFMPLNYSAAAAQVAKVAQVAVGMEPHRVDERLLAALNQAEDEDTLTVLPTIGKATAKVVLSNRPKGGYASVADAIALNRNLMKGIRSPNTLSWEKLRDHFAEVG